MNRKSHAPRAERAKRAGYASGRKVRHVKSIIHKNTGPTPNALHQKGLQ